MTQQIGGIEQQVQQRSGNGIGIALSGGGVRSAAFSLGALQALQKKCGLVHGPDAADLMAAVSGGSYTAAAVLMAAGGPLATPSQDSLGRRWDLADEGRVGPDGHPVYLDQQEPNLLLLNRMLKVVPPASEWVTMPSPDPLRPGSVESDYLRVHARYLLEVAPVLTVLQFAWMVVFSVATAVAGAIVVGALGGVLWDVIDGSGWAQLGVGFGAFVGVMLAWAYANGQAVRRTLAAGHVQDPEILWRDVVAGLGWVTLAFLVAVLYVEQGSAFTGWFWTSRDEFLSSALVAGIGGSSALGGLLLSLVRAQLAPSRNTGTRRSRWAVVVRRALIALIEVLLLLLVPLTFLAAFVLGWLRPTLAWSGGDVSLVGCAVLVLGLALALAILLGDRALSPHALYRNRLSRAFSMVRQRESGQPRPFVDPGGQGGESAWKVRCRARLEQPRLSALAPRRRRDHPQAHGDLLLEIPELLICASVNISEAGIAAAGSHARPIVFSPSWIYLAGEPTGRVETAAYEEVVGRPAGLLSHSFDATVMSYVALTGAAVSPSMGKYTKGWLRSVLTLLNIRLGTWIPNPASEAVGEMVARGELRPELNRCPGPALWLRELRGRHFVRAKRIYVSDGGHYENLGIVELIRRGCTEVWAIDASDDDRGTWRALSESLNLIASELGCEISGDFSHFEEVDGSDPESRLIRRTFADVTVTGLDAGKPYTATIHVVKLGMSPRTNPVVSQLGRKYRKFPYDSTLNQLYTAERFDLYRALGYDSASQAIDAVRAGTAGQPDGCAEDTCDP